MYVRRPTSATGSRRGAVCDDSGTPANEVVFEFGTGSADCVALPSLSADVSRLHSSSNSVKLRSGCHGYRQLVCQDPCNFQRIGDYCCSAGSEKVNLRWHQACAVESRSCSPRGWVTPRHSLRSAFSYLRSKLTVDTGWPVAVFRRTQ